MTTQSNKVKVFGKRVLIEKEKLDVGGMKLTPGLEEDGQKNTGKIIAVGQVGLMNRLAGIQEGKTIYFRKFFIANANSQDQLVFVNVEDITAIA